MGLARVKLMFVTGLLLVGSLLLAEPTEFGSGVFKGGEGSSLPYRIYRPESMETGKTYPLILFLHGAGERGSDNEKQLKHGLQDILAYSQRKDKPRPVIIIAPQCPANEQWVNTPWGALSHTMPVEPSDAMRLTIELLMESIKTMPVDRNRIYVTGISMGGFGAWDIIQRYPDLFAAALPICGGGDVTLAPKLADLPIWAVHGGKDKVVKVNRSRDMIAAIRAAGGTPKYTEYKNAGHNTWTRTFQKDRVLGWLFSQKRRAGSQ